MEKKRRKSVTEEERREVRRAATMRWRLANVEYRRAYEAEYNRTHRDTIRAKDRRRYAKHRVARKQKMIEKGRENTQKLITIRQEAGCKRCGFRGSDRQLVFHHLYPESKEFLIGTRTTKKWSRIEEEIAKCIVLCNSCHTKLHFALRKIS